MIGITRVIIMTGANARTHCSSANCRIEYSGWWNQKWRRLMRNRSWIVWCTLLRRRWI